METRWKRSISGSFTYFLVERKALEDPEELFNAWVEHRLRRLGERLYYYSGSLGKDWRLDPDKYDLLELDGELLAELKSRFGERLLKMREKLIHKGITEADKDHVEYRLRYKGIATSKQLKYIDDLLKQLKELVIDSMGTDCEQFLYRQAKHMEKWRAAKSIDVLNRIAGVLTCDLNDIENHEKDFQWLDEMFVFPFGAKDFNNLLEGQSEHSFKIYDFAEMKKLAEAKKGF